MTLGFPKDGTATESPIAVIGPPWRVVKDPRRELVSHGVKNSCGMGHQALAAFSPFSGRLVRATDKREVERRAHELARSGDGSAMILQGCIRRGDGSYLWPIVTDRVCDSVRKADDPLTRPGFARIVENLWNGLLATSTRTEQRAAREGLARIARAPWPSMSAREVDQVLSGLGGIISGIPTGSTRRAMVSRLERVALSVASRSKALSKLPGVTASFTRPEAATARAIGGDSMAFITNEFGQRSARFDELARGIIASGTRQGLGQEVIARRLAARFSDRVSGRSEFYYRVVASTSVSRSRSFGQAHSYKEADFDFYVWESALDERTCEVCRFLHGQRFAVGTQLARFEEASAIDDPEEAVKLFPWYQIRGGEIFVAPRGEPLGARIATVTNSAMGTQDERGTFRVSNKPQNTDASQMPPAHGLCRCTTIPDI